MCHQRHKSLFFNPVGLFHSGFGSFSVAIQKPGDLILTDTEGCHQGYNTGNNIAIAVNWATQDWLFRNFSAHLSPQTRAIIYDCYCFKEQVGIPKEIWSSNAPSAYAFNSLYSLAKKTKLSSKEFGDAETTWCFYIFLGVKYLQRSGYQISWL